ncbi:hypothetical protein D3C77_324610 [compost metagenome]
MNRATGGITGATLALLLAAPTLSSGAENMLFTGNLWAPACTVSDRGGQIDLRFNSNIAISKIDGTRYRQAIPYQIDCPRAESGMSYSMRLTLQGVATQFDPAAIQTSTADLGVKILLGGSDFILNQPRNIGAGNASSWPALEAVPVKMPGASLASGDFSASALLLAELY